MAHNGESRSPLPGRRLSEDVRGKLNTSEFKQPARKRQAQIVPLRPIDRAWLGSTGWVTLSPELRKRIAAMAKERRR